ASLRVMASPSPVPPKRCAVVVSAWLNSSNSLAFCSAVMPMPVSAIANSTQRPPLATLRARSLTSPSLVNLQALLNRLSSICRSRMGSTINAPRFSWASTTRRLLVCSSDLRPVPRSADDLVNQRSELHGLRIKLELSGLDLREVEHLVDEAKKVSTSAVHALQRLLRLFRAEARRIGDQHIGEPDDGAEWRAQLVAHTGYELRLVPARLRELPVLILDFVEQTHVLNRDHCLVREGSSQVDLLFGERLDSPSVQDNHANRSTFAQQGHSQHRAN